MTRVWRILAATLLAVLFSVTLTAGAASAHSYEDQACMTDPAVLCNPPAAADSTMLPVNRWSDATGSMHSRLGTNAWDDVAAKIQRNGTYYYSRT